MQSEPLKLSLYRVLQKEFGTQLKPIQQTKAALVEISHALEGTILDNNLPGMIFTGFQESSYWVKEVNRYRELAGLVQTMAVFSGLPKLPAAPSNNTEIPTLSTVMVTLSDGDLLRQEWFILAVTTEFSVLLCGLDRAEPVNREPDRVFDTVLSFEPAVIERTLNLLEEVLAHYRQDKLDQLREGRRLFPVLPPSPAYLSLLTTQFLQQSNYYRKVVRQLDQNEAMYATIRRLLHDASQPTTTLLALLELSQQIGEVDLDDISVMLQSSNELKEILDRLRQVSQFRKTTRDDADFLDTGEPLE